MSFPEPQARAAAACAAHMDKLRHVEATVEDSAEATVRIYGIIAELFTADRGHATTQGAVDGVYRRAAQVAYRGDFKPELAQLLARAAGAHPAATPPVPGVPLTREQLTELLQTSPEVEVVETEIPADLQRQALVDDLEDELAERSVPSSPDGSTLDNEDDTDGPLAATEPVSFVYDEWDAQKKRYRENFCLLHERPLPVDKSGFFEDTLRRHAALAKRIRRQFEAIALQLERKSERLTDGEDYDLDAVVSAVVERRCGGTPSDKLFFRRNKQQRSVVVAFLLDMSASTSDPIDGQRKPYASGPDVPRIIDLEKEALVLLVHALAVLGDAYAVYGFSGYTRKNVEFYVIKEPHEVLSLEVMRRISSIEPCNTTRMGPAIRHTTEKLRSHPARSKYLFLLSDGRPQDRGYGSPGESKHYAVQDTRAALLEARRKGITPFCLTVDKEGQADLATMMQDMSYEVLWDITMLPQRLPELYRLLTT